MIITNNCDSSFVYKDIVKHQYIHPFTWCIINYNDWIKFVENFETIDFYDIKICHLMMPIEHDCFYSGKSFFTIVLNSINVHIYYVHTDEEHKYMDETIYYRRLNRMYEYGLNNIKFIYIKMYHAFDIAPDYIDHNRFEIISKLNYPQIYYPDNMINHSLISNIIYEKYKDYI